MFHIHIISRAVEKRKIFSDEIDCYKFIFQLNAVGRYIDVINPLDVYQPGWREEGLNNLDRAFKFLKTYQFSSFPDKIGERKSKILAPEKIINKYTYAQQDENDYIEFIKDFLKQQKTDFYQDCYIE